ncbi:MAG: SUMF1/EgtB/PvdO family nonheme iron enzyme [Treponema sp.]|nr:SUMF1/EgtB/PvdO family nonheme iron enzyme [Treponema sp.]MCL2245384.1 SUMF1/EgtB/PvdO family nonheme iron enzyme [Treponema sp.]
MKRAPVFLFIFLIGSLVFAQQNVSAPPKFALVIGNGAYTNLSRLANPVNDANDVAAALRNLGFNVTVLTNANLDQMMTAVMQFKNRLSVSENAYGLFFYAGHGVQMGGVNYLIPADANIPGENFLRTRSLAVQEVLDEINSAGNELNIVVLDACRDNPFSWGSRSGSRGLAVVAAQPAHSIIVYATSAGSVASDGTGRNGLFTSHFLTNLRTPGLSIQEVFNQTGDAVSRSSNRQQVPAIYSQYFRTAYFGTQPAPVVQPPVTPQPPAATVQPTPAANTTVPAGFVRIQGGTFTMGSPANEPGYISTETQRQVTVSSFSMGVNPVTVGEFRRFVNASRYQTEAERSGGGHVWTGSQWETRADANWRNPYFTQADNHPVVLVTWNEAVQYCNWLSAQEGLTPAYNISGTNVTWNRSANGYRLPTEAEWEYACRAGTTTAYNTGASITTNQANYDRTSYSTTPVGNYAANRYGLHDMHGNVWEWCWDWYGDYPAGAQNDPTGASSGWGRVLRGGSWNLSAAYIRSASRNLSTSPTDRGIDSGFRVVRN